MLGADRSPRGHVLAPLRCQAPPTHAAIKREIWDDNNLGNAIPGATPRARIDVQRAAARVCRSIARAGRPVTVRTTVRNLSTRPFPAQASYGRRLVRVGAQLCARDGIARRPRLRTRLAARRRCRPPRASTSR